MPGSPASSPQPRACFEFDAPPDWRQVDFISDLHLSDALPQTFGAWSRYMLETSADAVFILGDLFELWVGDDMRSRPFEAGAVEVLREASCRRRVAFLCGNRDFLLGTGMLAACGMTGLPDPSVLSAWGQRLLLSHGDALCIADTAYQTFRSEVRSARWQQSFLGKPLDERLAIGAAVRRASAERRAFDGDQSVDADTATAVMWLHGGGADTLIHGHTHRPGSDELAPGLKRYVLSDWDLDDPSRPRAEVLRLSRDGLQRLPAAQA